MTTKPTFIPETTLSPDGSVLDVTVTMKVKGEYREVVKLEGWGGKRLRVTKMVGGRTEILEVWG